MVASVTEQNCREAGQPTVDRKGERLKFRTDKTYILFLDVPLP